MNLYGSLSVYSTDAFSEHYSQTRSSLPPSTINGNISYEVILKHRKYRCYSLVSFFILFIENYDEGIAGESFSFKIILRSPWYHHLSFNVFLFNVVFLTTIFPSQLDLLIQHVLQTSLLSHWSLPSILVDTISREVTGIQTYF